MFRWLIFLLSISTTLVSIADPEACATHHCMIVVDAGSTGSRMELYAYDLNAKEEPINITSVLSEKITPGFATLQPASIESYLTQLFEKAPNTEVPVYFYATAGMRQLPPYMQKDYYNSLKQWFTTHPSLHLIDAKTITGKEEGIYGWLAVNYQLGNLTSDQHALAGVMDTGGASVQITFPLNNASAVNPEDVIRFSVYGRPITLFVHSFLGLGQKEISHQYLEEKTCFPKEYTLPNGLPGVGDIAACQNKVLPLVNQVHEVDSTVQPVLEENPVQQWYVIGGISYLAQAKAFSFPDNQFTLQELYTKATSAFCDISWEKLESEAPRDEYIATNCLTAASFYALIVNGYGINAQTPIHYFPLTEKNNSWTLGVVLHH